MIAIALQSGSNGNCIYVEAGGARLLFDAGISGRQAERRLAAFGRDIRRVDAVILSHDHADHVSCAGIYQRKFGLPVFVTRATLRAANRRCRLGRMEDVRSFQAGATLRFADATVETISTPHDAADGAAFIVNEGRLRLGLLTDLGHPFEALGDVVRSLDAVILESNYDPEMLETGPYPPFLKRRIRGPHGHLSNFEAAALLRDFSDGRLRWACLAHLSEQNNEPGLARRTHEAMLAGRFPLRVASRHEAVGPLVV